MDFLVPDWVMRHNVAYLGFSDKTSNNYKDIKQGLKRFKPEFPDISIIIPAFNEAGNILKTLSSLAGLHTNYKIELIVVDNNSTDNTQEVLDALEVHSVFEKKQGISFARQCGLEAAKGRFILNADADTIYPAAWADSMAAKLQNPAISCVYGRYSFIPSPSTSRVPLAFYELASEKLFKLRRKNRDYLNVLGFNFGFRAVDGFKVGGFNVTRQRWQDGWMAMMLMKIGKIELVADSSCRVWTSDRRLMYDGSLFKAFANRFRLQGSRMVEYILPGKKNIFID